MFLQCGKFYNKKKPDDFVIATGQQYSIKQFISLVLKELNMKVQWQGEGINEKAFDINGNCIIKCNKRYLRPSEVESLLGNSKKARKKLNWKPKIKLESLIQEMIKSEYDLIDASK